MNNYSFVFLCRFIYEKYNYILGEYFSLLMERCYWSDLLISQVDLLADNLEQVINIK